MSKYIYYSEEEEIFLDKYKGHFNKKLADWAIANMRKSNATTGVLEPIKKKTIEEFDAFLKANDLKIADESYYDAYYLLHMSIADYPDSLKDDKSRAAFIDETINDVDCVPTAVLACFVTKMGLCGIPIYFERFL